ncbi:hypothetical protein JHK82_024125 [Glycine max]|nr:hypothetical protein JHK87_024085 [Glycine soja]KAG5006148.1 hypothetical protein JHK85_024690 [Glycine max]KAG5011951.1 hypothetical protein JHK86_024212 [Glycine max]KAG5132937.1 hypothetical protein JHK82_024125 [Glycine max]
MSSTFRIDNVVVKFSKARYWTSFFSIMLISESHMRGKRAQMNQDVSPAIP